MNGDFREDEIKSAVTLINKHFQTDDTKLQLPDNGLTDYTLLRDNLFRLIRYLVEHNFERLLSGMYRIDVSEARFNEAMETGKDFDEVAYSITDLVLEREMQKVAYRKKYS